MALDQDDIDDIISIIEEINTLSALPLQDMITLLRDDPGRLLCEVPLPTGGHISIRHHAYTAFDRIIERLIARQPHPADFNTTAAHRQLRREFGRRFIDERRAITEDSIQELLIATIQAADAEHDTITHFIPCIALHTTTPDHFRIGPVRFRTTARFLREHEHQIAAARERERNATITGWKTATARAAWTLFTSEEDARALADKIVDGINNFYREHDWIADITVPRCHPENSEARAERAVQASLDVLKLIFGAYLAHNIRRANARALPKTTGRWTMSNSELHPSTTYQGESILSDEGWFSGLGPTGRYYLKLAGITINGHVDPSKQCDIGTRFLDGLHWYGEAVSEPTFPAAIVKYAAALERLTITPDIRGKYTKTVGRRTATLAAAGDKNAYEEYTKRTKELYDRRSELMHGRRSPHHPVKARNIDQLVAHTLFHFLELTKLLTKKRRTTDDDLAKEYQRLEAH